MFPQSLGSPRLADSHLSHLALLLRLAPWGRRLQLLGATGMGGVEAGEACAQLRRCTQVITT